MDVQYYEDRDLAVCDGYKFRRDKRTGYYLSSSKINGKRMRLHMYVWEKHHGPVNKKEHIHHIDKDKYNNEISNLIQLPTYNHLKYHADENVKAHYDDIVNNIKHNALPKAIEWHKSDNGRAWHKKHYEQCKDKLHIVQKYSCVECGAEFESKKIGSKFCCNSCKSAYRRKSGVDDVVKKCECCGESYAANKYQKTKYCAICKGKKH